LSSFSIIGIYTLKEFNVNEAQDISFETLKQPIIGRIE